MAKGHLIGRLTKVKASTRNKQTDRNRCFFKKSIYCESDNETTGELEAGPRMLLIPSPLCTLDDGDPDCLRREMMMMRTV